MLLHRILTGCLGLVVVACGSESAGEPDATVDDGFETLLSHDWSVPAASEQYYCIKKTFDEDIVISAIEAIAPPGTHHTVVTAGDPNGADGGPDGVTTCGSYNHHFESWLFESSTSANRYQLPDGMAARIKAGQQVNINIHILNASDETMTGTTGTRIKRMDPALVENYATILFMGKVSLSVPPGESTHVGECAVENDVNIIAVQPHMHSHATHQKVVAHSSVAGSDQVLMDAPFDFDKDMYFRDVTPELQMKQGDIVEVHCSYNNDTGQTLAWGQSSWDAEMCFNMVYVYPAENITTPACAN